MEWRMIGYNMMRQTEFSSWIERGGVVTSLVESLHNSWHAEEFCDVTGIHTGDCQEMDSP